MHYSTVFSSWLRTIFSDLCFIHCTGETMHWEQTSNTQKKYANLCRMPVSYVVKMEVIWQLRQKNAARKNYSTWGFKSRYSNFSSYYPPAVHYYPLAGDFCLHNWVAFTAGSLKEVRWLCWSRLKLLMRALKQCSCGCCNSRGGQSLKLLQLHTKALSLPWVSPSLCHRLPGNGGQMTKI